MAKISKSRRYLDLDWTMPNIELIRAFSVYYNRIKFQMDYTIIFCVIVYTDTHAHAHAHTQTARQTAGHTPRHTDAHEYSKVAVDKPQL